MTRKSLICCSSAKGSRNTALTTKGFTKVSIALKPLDERGRGTGGIELHRTRLDDVTQSNARPNCCKCLKLSGDETRRHYSRHAFLSCGVRLCCFKFASFRDCFDCPEMLLVPGGDFLMGSPHSVTQAEKAPPKRAKRERPVHHVRIATFALGKHEVTREQYAAFVEATDYHKAGGCRYWTGTHFESATGQGLAQPGISAARQSSRCLHQLA